MADIIKALNEGTSSDGGNTVPIEFAARLLELITAKTVTLPDLEQVNMNTSVMYIPKNTSGTTAYIVSELGTITPSQQGYGRITLTAKKFAALVEASTELFEDNNVALAGTIASDMGRDLALKIDNEILNGTTGGSGFVGLRDTASYTNSVSANGTVGGTGGANISITPISKAIDEVLKDNHEQPDVAYFNPRTVGSLRLLTDSTARPMFNAETFGSPLLANGVIGTIYGAGVKTTSQLPVNISAGTSSSDLAAADAIVGRSKMFGIYGARRGITAQTQYRIDSDRNAYQVTLRSAFAVKYADAYCVIRNIWN